MNLVLGTAILAWLLAGCALLLIDIHQECRYQTEAAEHDDPGRWGDG